MGWRNKLYEAVKGLRVPYSDRKQLFVYDPYINIADPISNAVRGINGQSPGKGEGVVEGYFIYAVFNICRYFRYIVPFYVYRNEIWADE